MVNIVAEEDCGNAPKKQYVKDFLVYCAKAEIDSAAALLTDDVELEIPGYASAVGIQDVRKLILADASRSAVTTLTIDNIISHGNRCAANGLLTFADNGVVAFCTVFAFDSHAKNARIKSMVTYSIVTK